jgi:hypothetical protein
MSKKERKDVDKEQAVREQMMRLARMDLQKAMEWIDASDPDWAVMMAERAVKFLEVARVL